MIDRPSLGTAPRGAGRPRGVRTHAKRWLLKGYEDPSAQVPGPHQRPASPAGRHRWWTVMCLSGVDYFSTLGYQPGIAALAAGVLSPMATLVLVALTLLGALPIYRRVARDSPHGEGSIAILEHLLPWWAGKLFVLVLLGFAATDFIITMTLSAADASAHLVENPAVSGVLHGQNVTVTLVLLALLAAVFLKGFREAITIAVPLVAVYLALNVVVIATGLAHIAASPHVVADWSALVSLQHPNPVGIVLVALIVFPKLALGLSGFETGVAVMPEVKGDPGDTEAHPAGRIHGARKLLTTSSVIMSVLLVSSSVVTTLLIPAQDFQPGQPANGRALSYLAHEYLGAGFGSFYDVSTILILWFAGASAMAGLLNLVPRYLPRYGMAPEWTRATRPLVLVFLVIAVVITLVFRANVDAQGGAYATGVLVLITSAAIASTVSAHRQHERRLTWAFGAVSAVFLYTTAVNVAERPEGLRIGGLFILGILLVSAASRVRRSFQLRAVAVDFDDEARRILGELPDEPVQLVGHEPPLQAMTGAIPLTRKAQMAAVKQLLRRRPSFREGRASYADKSADVRARHRIPEELPLVFLEVTVVNSSDYTERLAVRGTHAYGFPVLSVHSSSVAATVAAVAIAVRDLTGIPPEVYIDWEEGNPISRMARYLLFGIGEVGPVAREVIRSAEPDSRIRPVLHIG